MYSFIVTLLFFLLMNAQVSAQLKSGNAFWKWTTWTILQSVPSITYFEDKDENNSSLEFGLQWQLIPLSYSFNSNRYVSPVQLFFIKPSERFSGSVELFFQPEYITGDFEYADLKKFMFKTGSRVIIPIAQKGEYLSFSLGMGYYRQQTRVDKVRDGMTYEAVVYFLFGMMGLKFNYNMNAPSKYNFGLYFKYY
jgi:hypothetical protein